ncbi:MAG: sulfotransferase [Rhodothermales bacterium]|nr:sulfotransferase [Rhodothermales bacterium]
MGRPSFFIVGNSKAGTTALQRFLRAHPGVFMCRPKEPNYFASDFCRDPDPGGSFHPRSEADYLALFDDARPDQLCGEASACYLYSREAARALHAFAPDARLLVMLREPVDFLYSYFLQLRKNPITEGESEPDFRTALALEDERRQGRQIPPGCLLPEFLFYSERVKYAEHLERLFEHFDRRQVKIILYDDFRADNAAVYRDVLDFLGLDPSFEPDFQTHNPGAVLRSKRRQRLLRRLAFGEGWAAPLHAVVTRLVPQAPRRALVRWIRQRWVFKPKEALDPALVRELKGRFRPEVVRLSELLGRDLTTLWGYGPPALAPDRASGDAARTEPAPWRAAPADGR